MDLDVGYEYAAPLNLRANPHQHIAIDRHNHGVIERRCYRTPIRTLHRLSMRHISYTDTHTSTANPIDLPTSSLHEIYKSKHIFDRDFRLFDSILRNPFQPIIWALDCLPKGFIAIYYLGLEDIYMCMEEDAGFETWSSPSQKS
ncbi:hypothetical protein L2E82_11871 [Cichorium intybus]|uniref:Uncharacterized protein n=1 Tax=Cichorium intybus TaxID=13427 RepID=A0ACB9GEI2_CICIN|nr:hypothetical protein L2E82_11871 [Cichorium intybus]